MDKSSSDIFVLVPLVDEGTTCYRPVRAECVGDSVFRLIDEQPDDEEWKFRRGDLVNAKEMELSDGELHLVAHGLAITP